MPSVKGTFTPRTTGNFYFGVRASGSGSPARFRGVMDEAGLFSRALTQAEIVSLYNTPGGPKPSVGLVGHWPFDGNGTEISAGRNAALTNAQMFATGVTTQAMYFDGVDDQGVVPASAALNVGTNAGVTLECWIGADNTNAAQALMEWNTGSGAIGANLWINANGTLAAHQSHGAGWGDGGLPSYRRGGATAGLSMAV